MYRFTILIFALFSFSANGKEQITLADIQKSIQPKQKAAYFFKQERNISVLTKPVLSFGEVHFDTSKGLCWQIQKPYISTLLVNEQGVFEVNNGKSNALLMEGGNPVFEAFSKVYLALFNGQINVLPQFFSVSIQMDEMGWTLDLLPPAQSPLSWLQSIEVSQIQGTNSLKLIEKNQDFSVITIEPMGGESEGALCW